MKRTVCTLAAILAASRLFAQGTMLVDQQSFDLATATANININGIGQSFTPSLSSVDYVQFGVFDISPGSSMFVNLRQNSLSGTIIGTTATESVPLNNGLLETTFLFSTRVILTPGTEYFFEPVVVVNATQINIEISNPLSSNPYSGGSALHGNAPGNYSLWFSEGILVPEPSTWTVFGLGAAALLLVGKRRTLFRTGG